MSGALRLSRGGSVLLLYPSQAAVFLGSGGECDLQLTGPGIPEVALRLMSDGQGGYLAQATDGVEFKLNGVPMRRGRLEAGTLLEIGENILALEEGETGGLSESRSSKVLAELTRIYRQVGEEPELESVLNQALHGLQALLGGDEAFVFTLESGAPSLFLGLTQGRGEADLFSDSVVQESLKTGATVRLENALADPRFGQSESVLSMKLRSVLCSPIRVAGKLQGLFYLGSSQPALSYGEEDQRICELYATLAGTLIHHVDFIRRQRRVIRSLSASDGLGIVATSPAMLRILEDAQAVADSDLSVLLLGESGTGKDLLAHYIHRKSRRRESPFLVLNCSTLRGELLASELFGHRKGAFTGAGTDARGLFASANGGTLFLDEIGEMDVPLQAAFLRVLETGRFKPLGQAHEEQADVRVLCATNRNLKDRVAQGLFREDLYFRINQQSFHLPPLRERGEDIVLLACHFLEKAKAQYPHKPVADFHPDSLDRIRRYAWPGNIRELANAISKAVVLARGSLVELDLPLAQGAWISMPEAVRNFQREYAEKAVAACGGDKEKAATLLGVGRSTLFNYLAASTG